MVSVLLGNGADKDARTSTGTTALAMAAGSGHLPVVMILLTAGADCKIADTGTGYSAFLLAAGLRHVVNLQALRQHGANVNTKDVNESTLLHHLCGFLPQGGHKAVGHLLRWGADEKT